jgi:hypothetical protein
MPDIQVGTKKRGMRRKNYRVFQPALNKTLFKRLRVYLSYINPLVAHIIWENKLLRLRQATANIGHIALLQFFHMRD